MDRAGILHSTPLRKKLWRFHILLREADRTLNLTRIRNFTAMVEKHYIDSLLPLKFLGELPSPLMDLGSGAGLPGIPLAIASPTTLFKLVEGRRVRVGFLARVVAELELPHVEVIARKLQPSDSFPVSGVITRALGKIPEILRLVDRSLLPGGKAIFMKGPRVEEELEGIPWDALGYRMLERVEYLLPFSGDGRVLVVVEKIRASQERYYTLSGVGLPSTPPPSSPKEEGTQGVKRDKSQFEPLGTPSHRPIRTRNNPKFKHWRKLLTGRGVRKYNETLLFGRNYLKDLLNLPPPELLGIIHPEGEEEFADFPCTHYWLPLPLYRCLDPFDTHAPVAWLKTRPLLPWDPTQGSGLGVVLMLQNPQNLGAALRTLAGMAISEIILLPQASSPFHPRSLRGSGPIPYRVPLYRAKSVTEILASGIPLYLLDPRGVPLSGVEFPQRFLLILGSEGQGTASFPSSFPRVALPMAEPGVESLNATVALALALSQIRGG